MKNRTRVTEHTIFHRRREISRLTETSFLTVVECPLDARATGKKFRETIRQFRFCGEILLSFQRADMDAVRGRRGAGILTRRYAVKSATWLPLFDIA